MTDSPRWLCRTFGHKVRGDDMLIHLVVLNGEKEMYRILTITCGRCGVTLGREMKSRKPARKPQKRTKLIRTIPRT